MATIREELLSEEYVKKLEEIIDKDWTLKKLARKLETSTNKPKKHCEILKEFEARRNALAESVIAEYMKQKDIKRGFISDLPEDKRQKYISMRNAMCFATDMLETLMMDMNSLFNGTNAVVSLEVPKCIKDAQETCHRWVEEDNSVLNDKQRDLYAEEADKCTEYIIERGRIFENKKNKLNKQDKEQNDR